MKKIYIQTYAFGHMYFTYGSLILSRPASQPCLEVLKSKKELYLYVS